MHFSDTITVIAVPSLSEISSRLSLDVTSSVSTITPFALTLFAVPQLPAYAKIGDVIESGGVDGQANIERYGVDVATAAVPVCQAL